MRRLAHLLAAAVLAALVLSGCFAPGDAEPEWPARLALPDDPMPHGDDHDHMDAAEHRYLWNYEVAAHDALGAGALTPAGLHALDLVDDWLFGALWGSHAASNDGGAVIWDVSDRTSPVEVGRFVIPGAVAGDRSIEATPDGDFLVIATEPASCFGHVHPAGVITTYLVDVRDKSAPRVVDVVSLTRQSLGSPGSVGTSMTSGVHSVTVDRIGDTDYAFLWGHIYRIDRTGEPRMVYIDLMNLGHDLYIRHGPDGQVWGLAAQGTGPAVVFDMADPERPQEIGVWNLDPRPPVREGDTIQWYFHTLDGHFFDDQTILVMGSEDVGDHVSPFWILDATDPAHIRHIGTWSNPGGVPAQHIIFSLHNQRFHSDGVMTTTHYHGGFWQFDFRDPATRHDPPVVAYGAYADAPGVLARDPQEVLVAGARCETDNPGPAPGVAVPEAPYYVDVQVAEDGILYIADVYGGLYTFRPTPDHPVYGAAWA